ncbi:MAG: N-acetyl-gamma-glutamyl-phosphate reductase, partial [Bacteroidota bacterium]
MQKYQVGIIGGAGYTAGELIRILRWHPAVELSFIHSSSQAGKLVSEIHHDLAGEFFMSF